MIPSAADRARALHRMNAAARRAPTPAMLARAATLARRMPTPAMRAKAAAIGRKLDGMARQGAGPTVVGCAGMSFAEAARLASEAERMALTCRPLAPLHPAPKGL